MMAINRFCSTFLSYEKYWKPRHVLLYFSFTSVASLLFCTPYILRHRSFYIVNGKWVYTNVNTTLVLQRSIAISIIGCYEAIGIVMSVLTVYRLKIYKIYCKEIEKNLILVTSLHIFVDIIAMFIMISEFLEWQFPLALFAVSNVFPVTYTVVILNSVTIVITNRTVREEYKMTWQFWKKRERVKNSSSRGYPSVAPPQTSNLTKVQI
uniref:Serpentine receptor class gamma n=1 Tax=Caenorhabditis japonica TaxID=281687 RepID=A0A8R1I4G2_CAEJA